MFDFDLSAYRPIDTAPKEVVRALVIWKTYGDGSNYWSCQTAYKSKWDGEWRCSWNGEVIRPEYWCDIPGIQIW